MAAVLSHGILAWACIWPTSHTIHPHGEGREMSAGKQKAKTFSQGLRKTRLQSNSCAGAALFCSRVVSVPDNFLALCCVAGALFPHP